MLQIDHRESRDIDIFLDDPQYLGFFNPDTNEALATFDTWHSGANFQKLFHAPYGEIDFIVAPPQTDEPLHFFEFETAKIPMDGPVETAIKKLVFRGSRIKPRDMFDILCVAGFEAGLFSRVLMDWPHHVEAALTAARAQTNEFVQSYVDALPIRSGGEAHSDNVRDRFIALLEAVSKRAR